ncbi:hypothetical protein DL765_009923 [Monosporascus sp. GIB2]|nr:hypothetical protein DL765_009923 [Monosporascus sp. GIB2]
MAMSYQPLGPMVMPIRDRSLPTPEPVPAKSRRYRSSLAFARMLGPKDVIVAQRFLHYDDKGVVREEVGLRAEGALSPVPHGSCGHRVRLDGVERGHRRRPGEPSHARASSPIDATRACRHRMTDVPGRLPLGWPIVWALDGAEILAGPGHPLMLGRATWDKHLAGVLELLCNMAGSKRAERQLDVFVARFRSLGDALGELRRCEGPARSGTSCPGCGGISRG